MGRKIILDDRYELDEFTGYWIELRNGSIDLKGEVRLIEDILHYASWVDSERMDICAQTKGHWVWKPVP